MYCNTLMEAVDGCQPLSRGDLCSGFERQQQFEMRQSLQHLKAGSQDTRQAG